MIRFEQGRSRADAPQIAGHRRFHETLGVSGSGDGDWRLRFSG